MKNDRNLIELWDYYATAGYENIYLVHITEDHRQALGKLFLPSNNTIYLDVGCGTGNMFELIVQKIQPPRLYAVDWSEKMLEKARLEALRLQANSSTDIKLFHNDVSKSLDWPDAFFDGVVSNLLITYLTCGWKKSVEELSRVLKPGGYLYLGTLLKNWGFTSVLWKHAPMEFLRAPITSFRGLKYRRIVARISKELEKHGAQFPSQQELVELLNALGFKEIKIIPTYWGGGLVLSARLL